MLIKWKWKWKWKWKCNFFIRSYKKNEGPMGMIFNLKNKFDQHEELFKNAYHTNSHTSDDRAQIDSFFLTKEHIEKSSYQLKKLFLESAEIDKLLEEPQISMTPERYQTLIEYIDRCQQAERFIETLEGIKNPTSYHSIVPNQRIR